MSIKYGRSMISMNEGKTAIFVDINEMAVSLRVIGGGIEHGQNVYLIVKKDGTKRYINMGQAEKRALSDKANIIKDDERLIGAALGRISENGAPLAGTFEGYIENEREKNNNAEPKNEKPVEMEVKKETETNILKNESEKPEPKTKVSGSEATNNSFDKEESNISAAEAATDLEENLVNKAEEDAYMEEKDFKKEEENKELESISDIESIVKDFNEKNDDVKYDEIKVHNTFKSIMDNFEKQMGELQRAGVLSAEEVARIYGNDSDNKNENTIEGENDSFIRNDIDYIFSVNEKLEPFNDSMYDWVRICMDELWALNIQPFEVVNPFVMTSDIKYGHLMLGRHIVKKNIVLAVPEKFSREDVKTAYDYGFKDFWRCGQKNDGNIFGYWIKNLK